MSSVLDDIVSNKRCEIAARKSLRTQDELQRHAASRPAEGTFLSGFVATEINLIAEIKPRSPSMGTLSDKPDIKKIVATYSKFARAISVLTDEKYFGGSLELLAEVNDYTSLPVLCKDFVIDPYQCYEARLAGAEAVLLIVKILTDEQLSELYQTTLALNMVPLVEIQSEGELERALLIRPQPSALLINNRNLSTMQIDLTTTSRLMPQVPPGSTVISASGILQCRDIESLLHTCNNFLIGSALMMSDCLEETLSELVSAKPLSAGSFGGAGGEKR